MTTSWHSYPSAFNLGHPAIKDLLSVPCYVEEKVDGSQFSFGIVDDGTGERLRVRSKGAEMYVEAPEKMFTKAVATAQGLYNRGLLKNGWTYRCEFLAKPKHNSLAYDRVPSGNLILFDVSTGDQEFLTATQKRIEADRLGLECVPFLLAGGGGQISESDLRGVLDNTQSVLGGQLIEGVVIKQTFADHYLFGVDKKVLMGKFVSERFREIHKQEWRKENPTNSDIVDRVAAEFCTEARWEKAIIHSRENGNLTDSPQDIGPLIKEIPLDVLKECTEEIKERLMEHFWPHIRRKVTAGFPEWYKDRLLRQQFNQTEGVSDDSTR